MLLTKTARAVLGVMDCNLTPSREGWMIVWGRDVILMSQALNLYYDGSLFQRMINA